MSNWFRWLLTPSPYTEVMALPENWNDNSFSSVGRIVVVTCPTNTWPGTSVRVVATLGTRALKNSPPGSVVFDRSCVYRPITRHRSLACQSIRRTSWRVSWSFARVSWKLLVPTFGAGHKPSNATAFGSRSAGAT